MLVAVVSAVCPLLSGTCLDEFFAAVLRVTSPAGSVGFRLAGALVKGVLVRAVPFGPT